MTRLLLFSLLILGPYFAFCQDFRIRYFNRNTRAGFENVLKFSLSKRFDSLNLRMAYGEVSRAGEFIKIFSRRIGEDTLFTKFYYKRKVIQIDTTIVKIIKPEVFTSWGGSLFNRKINSENLKFQGGFIFYIRASDDHWEPVSIKSYRFSIIRNGACLYSAIEDSPRFSSELNTHLDALKHGDIILISEITLDALYAEVANVLPSVIEIE